MGVKLSKDVLQQVSELEENIIKKDILPIVTQNIEPALKQVQRELVLVVDYHPGKPISVSLSRKTNIAELVDAKLLEQELKVKHIVEYGVIRLKYLEYSIKSHFHQTTVTKKLYGLTEEEFKNVEDWCRSFEINLSNVNEI